MPNQLGYLSLALYVASFICYARNLSVPNIWVGRAASLLLAGGIFVQYLSLYQRSLALHTVPYDDLYGSMSLFAWLLGITYLGLELFHRQRSVGAFVTLLLVCWIALLGLLTPRILAVPTVPRGAIFAFHVTLNTWAYAAFALSFVLSVIYGAGSRAAFAAAERGILAISGAGRAGAHGAQQRVRGIGGADFRRGDGIDLGTPAARQLFVRRSESDCYAGDSGGVRGVPAAFAQRELARGARGAAVRDEFRHRAVQLYVCKFISHEVSPVPLMPTATNPNRAGTIRIQVALIGCNHRTAPVELRERIVFTSQQALQAADELKERGILEEAVVFSTCNRSELYGVPGDFAPSTAEAMEEYFTSFHKIPYDEMKGRFYRWAGP